MPAKRTKPLPVPANLEAAVHATASAYKLGPEHSAALALAVSLAKAIDEMPDDVRAKMIGQSAGALLRALEALTGRAVLVSSVPSGRWNALG